MADHHDPGCGYFSLTGDSSTTEHVIADLHHIGKMLADLHAELEEFRPLLRLFKPGNGTSDLQKAGVLRTLGKAVRR